MSGIRRFLRRAARIVPEAERADWLREWDAELAWRERTASNGAARAIGSAAGAVVHALWLRKRDWSPLMMLQELRYAARALARRPGFTLAAVLTLALGIGANTAIFSVVYGVLLRPLPFRDPGSLVQLWETNPLKNWTEATIAPANLLDWRARNRVFEGIGFYMGSDTREGGVANYTMTEGEARQLDGLRVSSNLFDVLGVSPMLGRGFTAEHETPGRHRVMVLSHDFWRQSFGADPGAIGRKVNMAGVTWEVIGVMPESFRIGSAPVDFWAPFASAPGALAQQRRPHYLRGIARLKPGVTVEQARDDLNRIAADLEREYPQTNVQMGVGLGPLDDWFVGDARRPLLVLLGAVGFVLLIACANVGSLVLARGASRIRELAIRTTLGASRLRVARHLMAESVLIAAAGSVIGLVLAWTAVRMLLRLAPKNLPRVAEISLDWPVLLFTVAVGSCAALIFGLVPALWASRASAYAGGQGTRTTGAHAAMRRALIVAEVALAVVLLAGAGLMMRSFMGMQRISPGFDARGVLTASISLPGARYDTDEKAQQFFERLLDAARALPGVTGAGATRVLPLEGHGWTGDLFVEGREGRQLRELRHKTITAGYLEALGVPLIAGRTFTRADDARAPMVVVANQTFARLAFPGQDPIGRRIRYAERADAETYTIIGIVGDERQDTLTEAPEPEVYEHHLQSGESGMRVLVRSPGDPLSVAGPLREIVKSMEPMVAVTGVQSMETLVADSLARERFSTTLVTVFGGAALLLAAVGIYGLAAFLVANRMREFGVRLALGASRADVFALVLRQNLGLTALGLAAGIALALAVSRAIETMLFGVGARDPLTIGAAAAVLLFAAVVASVIPARRAVRIDPAIALRAE